MQFSPFCATRAFTPHHQPPTVGLSLPRRTGWQEQVQGVGDEIQELSVRLHFTFQGTKCTCTYSRRSSSNSPMLTPSIPQHPSSSSHHSALSFTSQIHPNSSCPLHALLPALPPSRTIQKVRFEIQGSKRRNVAGSGVREAERGGISPLQPFASMNQQPQSSCQAQGAELDGDNAEGLMGTEQSPHPAVLGLLSCLVSKLSKTPAKTHLNAKPPKQSYRRNRARGNE